jgi:hypothetical protein
MAIEEDEGRLGYCDVHPESQLLPSAAWLAGQYGGDKADCNPFEFWRCSRSDCDRCYDPDLFGYFGFSRQVGERIRSNPRRQERCDQHDERPFMVIGKFGQGRRFRCPFHDCDQVGSWAAESVADVVGSTEPQSSGQLAGDAKKEAFELSTFVEFANAADLAVEFPQNARPPRPDIHCHIDGQEYWFELGRIADTKLAKAVSIGWPKDPTPFSFAQKEPLLRIIEKKAAAHYDTNGRHVDLVF